MEEKILFVDDDTNVLEAYRRKLRRVLPVETADSPRKGLQLIAEKSPYAVVVADMQMPEMNGIDFLARVQQESPNTVRMMLTGRADVDTAVNAVNNGNVFRFLIKPCPAELMGESLIAAINQYRLVMAEKELLENTLHGTSDLLAEVLSLVAPDSFGSTMQLRDRARLLAPKLNMGGAWELEVAATLSRLGYVAVPDAILDKTRTGKSLTEDEQAVVARVPEVGYELLASIPRLENVAQIVRYQAKRYDGSGMPADAAAGEDIPLGSRILKVLSDMLELESGGASKTEALKKMRAREGWYDPRVLTVATAVYGAGAAPKSELKDILVRVDDLRVGLMLLSDIRTSDGRLLIAAGHRISEPILARIRSYARLVGIREPIEIRVGRMWPEAGA